MTEKPLDNWHNLSEHSKFAQVQHEKTKRLANSLNMIYERSPEILFLPFLSSNLMRVKRLSILNF